MNNQPTPNHPETTEQITEAVKRDIRNAATWFDGWDNLRKVIDELEQQSKENAGERHFSRDL